MMSAIYLPYNKTFYFVYFICVLPHNPQCFNNKKAASITVGGTRAVPRGNPQQWAGCWKAFPLSTQKKTKYNALYTISTHESY